MKKQIDMNRVRIAAREHERRIKAAGCKDRCKTCKLSVCARKGVGAIIGELGDIEYMKTEGV